MIPDDAGGLDLGDHHMMITTDPPLHSSYRRLASPDFIPRAARALRPRIEELATRHRRPGCGPRRVRPGRGPGRLDAVVRHRRDARASRTADGVELYKLTEAIHAAPESQAPGAGMMAVVADVQLRQQRVRREEGKPRRRPVEPADQGEVEVSARRHRLQPVLPPARSTPAAIPRATLSPAACRRCSITPTQLARLQADVDGLLPTAIEEMLRWVSPVIYMRRTATADTEVRGPGRSRKATRSSCTTAPPTAIPSAFTDAERFDVGRTHQRPRRLRRRRTALLPGRAHRPLRDRRTAPRDPHASARHGTHRTDRVAAVELHLRAQAPAGAVHAGLTESTTSNTNPAVCCMRFATSPNAGSAGAPRT